MKKQILRKLASIVGAAHVQSSREDLLCYRYDGTATGSLPDVVVHPQTAAEVAQLMELAANNRIHVVPRGAGTGLSGGSLPADGGLVMSFDRMDRIIKIDSDNLVAHVEPGVINRDLKVAVDREGLFYPPDPSSTRVCTLGGNVAENAGGPYGVKYGVTGDYVLGLQAVLADGSILSTGGENKRDVTGYDLTSLLVGSEGTLAIVTSIILRLLPKPPARRTALFLFDDLADAGATVRSMADHGLVPAALEIMDRTTIDCVSKHKPGQIPEGIAAALLLEVNGEVESVDSQMKRAVSACQGSGGRLEKVAETDEEADIIWDTRRAVSPALGQIAPTKIGEDISVPPARVPEMIERIADISRENDLPIAVFGHAGDGNLHPNILADSRDEKVMVRTGPAIEAIFKAALELGGTLSGEHGIGTTKAPFMKDATQAEALRMMKEIKKIFDPKGLLNPGKIFARPE